MRSMLYFIIFVAVVALVCMYTRPDKEKHVNKISSVVLEAMRAEAQEEGAFAVAAVNELSGYDLVARSVDRMLVVESYGVFSVGKVIWNDDEYYVSLGVLNTVITFSSDMLRERIDSLIDIE